MERKLRELMEGMTDVLIPRKFNQALMELGAMICVPNGAPHCEECPWQAFCEARLQNRIAELPVKKKAKARRVEEKTVFVICDGEKVALHKRGSKGLLAGLYELPNCEGKKSQEEALAYVKEIGCKPIRIRELTEAKHIFSHVEWHMKGYTILIEEPEQPIGDLVFVEAADAKERYAVPSAFSAYWNAIKESVEPEA